MRKRGFILVSPGMKTKAPSPLHLTQTKENDSLRALKDKFPTTD